MWEGVKTPKLFIEGPAKLPFVYLDNFAPALFMDGPLLQLQPQTSGYNVNVLSSFRIIFVEWWMLDECIIYLAIAAQ